MSQLESLTAFITANLPPDAMQMFSSSMEDCELVRNAKALGNNQRRIGVLTYTARLSWDDFPYRKYSPGLIYALVLAWVDEFANELRDELKLADLPWTRSSTTKGHAFWMWLSRWLIRWSCVKWKKGRSLSRARNGTS